MAVLLVFCLAGCQKEDAETPPAQGTEAAETAAKETVPDGPVAVGDAIGGWTPSGNMPAEWGSWKRVYFFSDRLIVLTKENETSEYPYEIRGQVIQAGGREIRLSRNGGQLVMEWGGRTLALDRYETAYAFEYEATENNTIRITKQYIDAADGDFAFPAEIDGKPVEEIDCSFHQFGDIYSAKYEYGLKIVFIPEGVKVIGDNALCQMEDDLRYCYLPSTLKTIGKRTFFFCRNLPSVIIPEGVESIGQQAFYSSGLTTLTLPRSVKTLEDSATRDMDKLTEARILCDQIYLKYEFRDCPKLKKITIDGGTVAAVGSFSECEALEEIVINGATVSLKAECLVNCPSLARIALSAGARLAAVDPELSILKEDRDFEGKDLLAAAAASDESRYDYQIDKLMEDIEKVKLMLQSRYDKLERDSVIYNLVAPELQDETALTDPAAVSARIHGIARQLEDQREQALREDPTAERSGRIQVMESELEAFLTDDLTYEKICMMMASSKKEIKGKAMARIIGHDLEEDVFSKYYPPKEKDQWKEEKVNAVLAGLTAEETVQIRLDVLEEYYQLEMTKNSIKIYEEELAAAEAQLAELQAGR